jgi:hypothetical protein
LGVRRFAPAVLARIVLVLLIVAILMWFRSHGTADQLVHDGTSHTWVVRSIYGRVVVQKWPRQQEDPATRWAFDSFDFRRPISDGWDNGILKSIGLQWGYSVGREGERVWWLRLRWPTLALVLAVTTLFMARMLRRNGERQGLA